MQLEAVLFDAMGTLIELEPPAPALRDELVRRLGIEVSLDEARDAMRKEIAYYRVHLDEGRDAESLAELRRGCATVIRDALPVLARVDLAALTEALLASLRFRPYSDVPGSLHALRDRGLKLVVVSNWDASLHDVLERLDLAPLFAGVLTSAETGERKPAPGMFERALRLVATDPARAIHVGDSLAEDVLGARAAGIEPVLIARDGGPRQVDGARVIADLGEL
jgi:putative hydrolase of the HAD superfamily